MPDDTELQAKIAEIAGKINQHKEQQHPFAPNGQYNGAQHRMSRPPNGRWSPYGRGGRAGYPTAHKNRTLILGGNQKPASPAPNPYDTPVPDATAFVTTRTPGKNQLMNKDTFDREQKQKQDQKTERRMAKKMEVDREERSRLMTHATAVSAGNREMIIDGLRFQLRDDGSKLLRIGGKHGMSEMEKPGDELKLNLVDPTTATKETPKKVAIADVNFFRTKNGNLVRASAVRGPNGYCATVPSQLAELDSLILPRAIHRKEKAQCKQFSLTGTISSFRSSDGYSRPRAKHHWTTSTGKILCSSLTSITGKCSFGPNCKFSHHPDKVAACKDFLRTGNCVAGQFCDLSHELTYHRVPACTHFLRGNCVKDACRYPHIHVSLAAPVCRPFATLGFCSRGEECAKRHVSECPDYANHGHCADRENGKCSLPHPDRASTLRKAAARQAKVGSENESDVSSDQNEPDDDVGFEDIDSDEAEDVIMGGDGYQHELTQQNDYIAFA